MNRTSSKAAKNASRHSSKGGKNLAAEKRLKSFIKKFLASTILVVIPLALIPENFFDPLNRLTAFLAGEAMQLSGIDAVVKGAGICVGGFSVNIIAECTSIHLIAFYTAFIFAFPATRLQKLIGFGSGAVLLFLLNLVRIATVTLAGRSFPAMFDMVHIYLGQLGMLTAVIVMCLLWCVYISGTARMNSIAGFFSRFIIFSGVLFLLWLPLNRMYVKAIDAFIFWLFYLASIHLAFPDGHHLYYQAFSLISLTGLLLAVKGVKPTLRMRWIAYGLAILTLFQIMNRLCNVWITAFNITWMVPVSQVVHIAGVYIVPLTIAICFLMKARAGQAVNQRHPQEIKKEGGCC
jgi:exosortase/archaeosortase family protein